MQKNEIFYPGKILLFGEYAILSKGEALALPINNFKGQWAFNPSRIDPVLKEWASYISISLDPSYAEMVIDFNKEIEQGMYFESNIPQGYGVGSSGALTAALFERYYAKENFNAGQLKVKLAELEGFFHGSSSGLDPLISLTQKSHHFSNAGLQTIEFNDDGKDILKDFYLIDTRRPRNTHEWVSRYNDMMTENFIRSFVNPYKALNQQCLDALLAGKKEIFKAEFQKLSKLQFEFLIDFIPEDFRANWESCLEDPHTHMKLCGAGGGGFIIYWSEEPSIEAKLTLVPVQFYH